MFAATSEKPSLKHCFALCLDLQTLRSCTNSLQDFLKKNGFGQRGSGEEEREAPGFCKDLLGFLERTVLAAFQSVLGDRKETRETRTEKGRPCEWKRSEVAVRTVVACPTPSGLQPGHSAEN